MGSSPGCRPADVGPQHGELLEGPGNDAWIGAGLLPRRARIMVHPYLRDAIAHPLGAGENLCINECSRRTQLHAFKHFSRKEFEGAVDIPHPQAEHGAHQRGPAERVEFAEPGILAIQPVARDHRGWILQVQDLADFAQIELAVAVGVKDPLARRSPDPGL